MSYFCILSNSKAFPDQDHSCLKMGQCNSCRDYQRGMFAPRYPVPSMKYDVIIEWDQVTIDVLAYDPEIQEGMIWWETVEIFYKEESV